MAEVGTLFKQILRRGIEVYEWTVTENGYGKPIYVPHLADKTYSIIGTWNGATVVLEGGFDKDDSAADAGYLPLHESDNTTAISLTADGMGVVLENPIFLRPKISNAGATTNLKIVLVAK